MSGYPGGYLAKTYPTPTGPTSTNVAPGIWTMGQQAALEKAGNWPDADGLRDKYFSGVYQLLHADGTNGATTSSYLDSSTNAHTITSNGTALQNTMNPYGTGWSTYFDGDGDYLSIADNTAFNLSGGTYTIEMWIKPMGQYANYRTIIAKRSGSGTAWEVYLRTGTGVLSFYNGNNYESSAVPTPGVWNHVAAVYDGTNINLYLNGTKVLQTAITNSNVAADVYIGTYSNEYFIGHIADVRVTKGGMVYTGSTFDVPTSPLSATTPVGTVSLLACTPTQTTTDKSSNNFTITRNGHVKTERDSPYRFKNKSYDDYCGGFHAEGGYLTTPSSTSFAFGTGDYAVETWVFPKSTSEMSVFEFSDSNDTVKINTSSATTVSYYNGSTTTTSATKLVNLQTWSHIALVRSSGTVKVYVNGVVALTQATTPNSASARSFKLGGSSAAFTGFISNTRVVKGYPIYTSEFTPPITPLADVTGTQLLLKMANAVFLDHSMSGGTYWSSAAGATISTTQKKYGSASLKLTTAGDYFSSTNTSHYAHGPFTWECWWYGTNNSNYNYLWCSGGSYYGTGVQAFGINSTQGFCYSYFVQGYTSIGGYVTNYVPPNNEWVHLAITRDENNVLRFFVNGVQKPNTRSAAIWNGQDWGPNATDGFPTSGNNIGFVPSGGPGAGGNHFGQTVGYIDDMRMTCGVARYISDFTPPTSAHLNK